VQQGIGLPLASSLASPELSTSYGLDARSFAISAGGLRPLKAFSIAMIEYDLDKFHVFISIEG